MRYNLSNTVDKKRFQTRCDALLRLGKNVEVTEKRHKRTLAQNRYLHLLLSFFATETGNPMEYVKQEYFKRLCNPDLFIREVDDPYQGRTTILRSSADLNEEEMTTAIDKFRAWSETTAGVYLPEPTEEEFIERMENNPSTP